MLAPLCMITSPLLIQMVLLPFSWPWELRQSPLFRGEEAAWVTDLHQMMLELEPGQGSLVSSRYRRQTICVWLVGRPQEG